MRARLLFAAVLAQHEEVVVLAEAGALEVLVPGEGGAGPPLFETTITLPGAKVETVPSLSFTVTSSLESRLRPGLPAP